MKELKNQIIANAGLNRNNVIFSEECLKDCVENIKEENLYIFNEFDPKNAIGYMTNFEYENGKIIADINLFSVDLSFGKVVRCAYEAIEKEGKNPIKVKKCRLLEGGLIEKTNDAERDLL